MALYDSIGATYGGFRRPDRRIADAIDAALGDATSVVNIGAGAGSYEPHNRRVLAVEPSEVMIRQRPADAAPCHQGSAEAVPLEDASVDAAMTILSLHHWADPERGLAEMARVARKRAVLLTWVPDGPPFWLTRDYFPELAAKGWESFPSSSDLLALLERTIGPTHMEPMLIPHDCVDGFVGAYWRRPESYLSAELRSAMSPFHGIGVEHGFERLRADLETGAWAERNGDLLELDALDVGYRLLRCELTATATSEFALGQ